MSQLPQVGAWGAELGNAFANIGAGAAKIMNPNKDIEDELKKRIAANPKIAQELFDTEAQNPGSIARIYGKGVSDWVTGRRQSAASMVEGATRDAFGSGRTTADIVKSPTAIDQAVTRDITGQNQAGYKTAEAGATVAGEKAKVAPLETQLQTAQINAQLPIVQRESDARIKLLENQASTSDLTAANAERVLKTLPGLQNADIQGLARKVYKNQDLTPEEKSMVQALGDQNNPFSAGWTVILGALHNKDALDETRRYHEFAMAKENQDLMGKVIGEWSRLGKPGGSATYVKEYMFNPKASAQAEQDAQLPPQLQANLPADRKALAQVAQAIGRDNQANGVKASIQLDVQERLSNDAYRKAVAAKEPDDQVVQSTAAQLSSVYTNKAQLAGNNVQITVTPAVKKPDIGGMGGQKVSYGDLTYQVTEQTASGPMTRTVDEADLRKLFVKPQADRTPGTGEPQQEAYKGSGGKTTVTGKSGSYTIGTDPALDQWAGLTAAARSAELRKMYTDEAAYKAAKKRLTDAGLEVY